jgi:ethanolamine utilization protein EutN
MDAARLRMVVPLSLEDLRGAGRRQAEDLVVYDELGAGMGSLVAVSDAAEAAQPLLPRMVPIDAYAAAILDRIDLA